jgi:hypothetical protein
LTGKSNGSLLVYTRKNSMTRKAKISFPFYREQPCVTTVWQKTPLFARAGVA